MLTDQELMGIAAQCLNMALTDRRNGKLYFVLASYHVGDVPPLHRMTKLEAWLVKKLGEDWLDHGDRKDAAFAAMRASVDLLPPDAVAFAFAANRFTDTEALMALPREEWRMLMEEFNAGGHDRQHQAVREGWLKIEDAISSLVQTPERACFCLQILGPDGEPQGASQFDLNTQAGLTGRLKMYGKETMDDLIDHSRAKADPGGGEAGA